MKKEFVWRDEKYTVDGMTLGAMKKYGELQKTLGASTDISEQADTCLQMLESLNCPDNLLEAATLDEFEELLTTLVSVQMGGGGGGEGNPVSEALTH